MSHGWSGSTLLGNVLGELDGAVHVGELRALWDEGLLAGGTCGCGLPLGSCRSLVGDRRGCARRAGGASGVAGRAQSDGGSGSKHPRRSFAASDRRRGRRWSGTPGRRRPVPDDPGPDRGPPDRGQLEAGGERRGPSAGARARCPLRAPGSGPARRGLLLAARADAGHGPVAAARDWSSFNVLFEAIRRRHGPARSVRVRYEDVVLSPGTDPGPGGRFAGPAERRLPLRDEPNGPPGAEPHGPGEPEPIPDGRRSARAGPGVGGAPARRGPAAGHRPDGAVARAVRIPARRPGRSLHQISRRSYPAG